MSAHKLILTLHISHTLSKHTLSRDLQFTFSKTRDKFTGVIGVKFEIAVFLPRFRFLSLDSFDQSLLLTYLLNDSLWERIASDPPACVNF